MPEAFRGMGGSPDDRVRPYTGPDLALRWQWNNSGATLVVEPAREEEVYHDAPTDEVDTYYDEDDAEREYYQYQREYENEQYDEQDTYDERDDEDYEDYVSRAFDEREQDYCSNRVWSE